MTQAGLVTGVPYLRFGVTEHLNRHPLVVVAGVADGDGTTFVRDLYVQALVRAGALPVVVAPDVTGKLVDELLDRADALVMPGGRDIDTARLGVGPLHPAARPGPAEQQDADVALLRGALERDLPVLGICYGMQLLGVVGGGSLHQHLPDDVPTAIAHFAEIHAGLVEHDIVVERGSRVATALSTDGIVGVNSGHHQALADLGPGWCVSARSSDGIVEAIESERHRFAVGVQWHPERLAPMDGHNGLFRALVEAARR